MSAQTEPGVIVMVVIPQDGIQKGEELEVIWVNRSPDGSAVLNVKRSSGAYAVIPERNVVFKKRLPPAQIEPKEAPAAPRKTPSSKGGPAQDIKATEQDAVIRKS